MENFHEISIWNKVRGKLGTDLLSEGAAAMDKLNKVTRLQQGLPTDDGYHLGADVPSKNKTLSLSLHKFHFFLLAHFLSSDTSTLILSLTINQGLSQRVNLAGVRFALQLLTVRHTLLLASLFGSYGGGENEKKNEKMKNETKLSLTVR